MTIQCPSFCGAGLSLSPTKDGLEKQRPPLRKLRNGEMAGGPEGTSATKGIRGWGPPELDLPVLLEALLCDSLSPQNFMMADLKHTERLPESHAVPSRTHHLTLQPPPLLAARISTHYPGLSPSSYLIF